MKKTIIALLILAILIAGTQGCVKKEGNCWIDSNDGLKMKGYYTNINDSKLGEIENCCCVSVDIQQEFICYCN